MTDQELQEMFTNQINKKIGKEPSWHKPISEALKSELDEVISRWFTVGERQNSLPAETKELLKLMRESIFLTLTNHENLTNNRNQ